MKEELTLIDLKENQEVEIISVVGGQMVTKRLADLGLVFGTKIKILGKAPFWGPIEIEVLGSKLALGRGIASKILVKILAEKHG
ncbi:MAG: FeoA domain-containing protein [Patescibacteria group bacterium]|nr:FeoA domain-containing protein [Patescibacteria group bacterium]MDD5121668.1 FeoA domain-containing protein [Patescibacteria group bacterium]MDD5222231.1 FeoA domain-containing protein [Patescibacteria group bacterium]MDD5396168.1 FeoA domain-containing protein [Patescibacteria group bacterium]